MKYKQITDDITVPVLGVGTWQMGGQLEPDHTNDSHDVYAIQKAIELGMNHIDTAEKYGAGHSEELVGKAIQGYERQKLFITTKVARENCAYDDVFKSIDASLARLQSSYVDLYLIHAPSSTVPFQETMKAMDELVEMGKVKMIGVSNFSKKQLQEAQEHTKNKIVANQIEYNLMVRNKGDWNVNMESEIIPYCQANDILVIAMRPFARGQILEKKNAVLHEIANTYNKTVAQVALNWLISKKGVVAIPKASVLDHLEENTGAVGWEMEQKDVKKLDGLRL